MFLMFLSLSLLGVVTLKKKNKNRRDVIFPYFKDFFYNLLGLYWPSGVQYSPPSELEIDGMKFDG